MKNVLLVGLGGFFGSILRYSIGIAYARLAWSSFPAGTLTVNLIGSLIIGLLAGYVLRSNNEWVQLALISGFCGGFTTFSTFSYDFIKLWKTAAPVEPLIYLLISIVGGIALCLLGLWGSAKFFT